LTLFRPADLVAKVLSDACLTMPIMPDSVTSEVRVTFRSPRRLVEQIEALAARGGHGRSEAIRPSVALAGRAVTLRDLTQHQGIPPDDPRTRKALAEVQAIVSAIAPPKNDQGIESVPHNPER
jgi:ribbon-helix-helix CopG family protein